MIVHEKKYTAIDAFDMAHWVVDEAGDQATYTLKPGAPPQTVTITRPDGGTQTHNDLNPGSSIWINRTMGAAKVSAA